MEKYPGTRVEIVTLDLGSQKSIRQAAADVAALTDKLDILINNAGIVVTSRQATPEGIEQQFGTNHIGPFLFTNLLLPLLRKAAESNPPGSTRVVSLSSAGHRLSPIRFSDYNFEGKDVPPEEDHFKPLPGAFGKCAPDGYNGIVTYAQSKTANILFTVYLQKHLSKQGIAAYCLHPGSRSNLRVHSHGTLLTCARFSDRNGSQPGSRCGIDSSVLQSRPLLEDPRRGELHYVGSSFGPVAEWYVWQCA